MQFGQKSLKLLTLIRHNNGAKLRRFKPGVKATTCKAKARDLTVEAIVDYRKNYKCEKLELA